MTARTKKPTADQVNDAKAKQPDAPVDPEPSRRTFIVASLILHDGRNYAPLDRIELTEAQHAPLFRAGAVIGAWADAADDGA